MMIVASAWSLTGTKRNINKHDLDVLEQHYLAQLDYDEAPGLARAKAEGKRISHPLPQEEKDLIIQICKEPGVIREIAKY